MNLKPFILLALLGGGLTARADQMLVQASGDTNATYPATLRLHGNRMRLDQQENTNGGYAVIIDLDTRDSLTLLPKEKKFLKRSGADILKNLALDKKLFGGTNESYQVPAPAVATGKTETVNGYETEIYTWIGAHKLTETLWVTKGFSNYENIRRELAKLDRFNDAGPHRNAQPALSPLPGMVVKSELTL
ncbi:MAG TPA: DUF4412 domain-containing protein, partial [Verrucomicrobiae bacterium]